jgi:hypothetical protein
MEIPPGCSRAAGLNRAQLAADPAANQVIRRLSPVIWPGGRAASAQGAGPAPGSPHVTRTPPLMSAYQE